MEKIWFNIYPEGVPHEINPDRYSSILEMLDESIKKFADKPAFTNMKSTLTYREVDQLSDHFAAFLQKELKLEKGDRFAIQSPNLLQVPVAIFGALKAGLTIVNTNPLYTAREMKHQFCDSGVKAILIIANYAHVLQQTLHETPIEHVIVTEIGDLFPWPKRTFVNWAVKNIKKMVPPYDIPKAYHFWQTLTIGSKLKLERPTVTSQDIAFLQYTGGTTGISKGAMLTHRNITANMEQVTAWMRTDFTEGGEVIITALPLYHIFSLTVNLFGFFKYGAHNILNVNPRYLPGLLRDMRLYPFSVMLGINTLFNSLANNKEFQKLDFSKLKISVAGGMALQKAVVDKWTEVTKSPLVEGYGLTETSPVASCNPIDGRAIVGTIGMPLPSTEFKICNDDGSEVAEGQSGEIWIRGPQVMKGYWQRPEDTRAILTDDGWIKTGDIGQCVEGGFFKIVDRKKDMILVSGFNVYPNEIEDVVAMHPSVLEVAAIGVSDMKSTESVKVFIVKKDDNLTKEEIIKYCRKYLTGYKVPKHVEFRKELPKSNVGKVLRRALKDEARPVPPGNV